MTTTLVSDVSTRRHRETCRLIALSVRSRATEKLKAVPLTTGVCLPRGQLFEVGHWILEGLGGAVVPVRTDVLNRWSDGSVRWMLVRFVAHRLLPGRTECVLVRTDRRPRTVARTPAVTFSEQSVCVPLSLQTSAADVPSADLTIRLKDDQHREVPLRLTDVRPWSPCDEQKDAHEAFVDSDVCSEWLADAVMTSNPDIQLRLHIQLWPAAQAVSCDMRIRNAQRARHPGNLWDLGDPGSFCFSSLDLQISLNDEVTGHLWKADARARVHAAAIEHPVSIRQYGSGGRAWSNGNHRDRTGRSTVRERGYRIASVDGVYRGHRCEPVVALTGRASQLTVCIPEFWQQFPSGLRTERATVAAEVFPETGEIYELQGGEQKTTRIWISARCDDSLRILDWVSRRPECSQPAESVFSADVFPWVPHPDALHRDRRGGDGSEGTTKSSAPADAGARFLHYVQEATSGEYSIAARREHADEYGWRHFGDIHADHEQLHYDGFNTLASHYNNQFDFVFGAIQNYLLTENGAWFNVLDSMARHVIDIDIYHTAKDRACFNGGLFWHTDHFVDAWTSTHRTYSRHNAGVSKGYGGGPSNEHNYTTGLLYYYFLTGNPDAREAVLSLADWVISMDDGTRTIWTVLDDGPTGLASQTVFEDYHGPGRGAGNSINALLDAWVLTRKERYLSKAEELIRRVVHPEQDGDELHLDDAEGHWSYTVCLTAIGRYLTLMVEADRRQETYAYARAAMQQLGRWMADNEVPSLSRPERLQLPTVAWAAQEFRKANVLRITACCEDDVQLADRMRQRANELNEAAWNDLYRFEKSHLTARCLSILLTEGLRDLYHRTRPPVSFPAPERTYTWAPWTMFVPQKLRVKRLLKQPFRLLVSLPKALNPFRIVRALDAAGRQFF